MKKTFLFLAIAVFAIQVSAQTHFSIHLGAGLPMGDFGAYKDSKIALYNASGKQGGAATGFDFGLKAKFDIPSINGLGVIVSGDFFFNGPNADFKDAIEDEENEENIEMTAPKYINIPLMVGANYTYNVSDKIGLFGEAAVGLNFRKITNATEEDDTMEEITKFDLATNLGFQIGAGVIFNEKFSIGINYYALGTSKVKGEKETDSPYSLFSNNSDNKFRAGKLSTNIMSVRIGFHF